MNKSVFTSIKLSTILITAGIAAQAHASGYHFGTQSVSSQATANSSAAEAADPSTIFYNPAGLTKPVAHLGESHFQSINISSQVFVM